MSVPWDKVDEEYVEKPKKWEPKSIGNFMRWFGPTSSIFDIVTYLFMYFIVCPRYPERLEYFFPFEESSLSYQKFGKHRLLGEQIL